jgi:16S rRNA (cytosine1402-N4)-methyltransferase
MLLARGRKKDRMSHVSVMAAEFIRLIDARPGQLLVDLTVGAGGHTRAFLDAAAPTGRVIAADRDAEALELAEVKLADVASRVTFQHGDSVSVLADLSRRAVAPDVILMDLGVSSMQLDDSDRGFSLREDGPLDMRMDSSQKTTAADIVNGTRADELERMLREDADEHRARSIVAAIVERRGRRPFRSTGDLRGVIEEALHSRGGRIHPATRTFQALRMATNAELPLLRDSIPAALRCLAQAGCLAMLAFHSGEDRIVKQALRAAAADGLGEILTPKPIVAGREETRVNRRSRSARLRVFRKGGAA